MFEDDEKINRKYSEEYKNKISEEIKKFKPTDIKNTIVVEEKFTLWQRLLKTLGKN
jgi:predicted PolB exonuclease-like 3'-5' exonuclease